MEFDRQPDDHCVPRLANESVVGRLTDCDQLRRGDEALAIVKSTEVMIARHATSR
jgi:hypothetical protein